MGIFWGNIYRQKIVYVHAEGIRRTGKLSNLHINSETALWSKWDIISEVFFFLPNFIFSLGATLDVRVSCRELQEVARISIPRSWGKNYTFDYTKVYEFHLISRNNRYIPIRNHFYFHVISISHRFGFPEIHSSAIHILPFCLTLWPVVLCYPEWSG